MNAPIVQEVRTRLQAEAPEVNEGVSSDMLKWAAGGFTLLTGLLTFFGIKEGVLARVVHENQISAMGVLLLLGLGVLLGFAAPAMTGPKRVPVAWVLVVVTLLLWLTELLSKDMAIEFLPVPLWQVKLLMTGVALAAFVVLVATGLRMPWSYAFAVVAVCSVSSGLYVAAKISIMDNGAPGTASVTATFDKAESPGLLTIKVAGSAIYTPVQLVVDDGQSTSSDPPFGSATFAPDRAGALEGSTAVLVPLNASTVVVSTCQVDEKTTDGSCATWTDQVRLQVPRSAKRVAASFSSSDGAALTYSVDGYDVPRDATFKIIVTSSTPVMRSEASVTAKPDGTFGITGTVKPTKGQTWTVSGSFCDAAGVCASPKPLATHVVPK